MKTRLLLLGACASLLGSRAHAQHQVVTQDHRHTYAATPVWVDDFDGTAVNPANWTFETTEDLGRQNNELQFYQKSGPSVSPNASVAGGFLTIQGRKEWVNSQKYGGFAYTSARMISKGLQKFTYGKMEARLQVPLSNGMWPAFWMMGENINDPGVGWPRCGEIDIMERVNTSGTVSSTQHWYDAGVNRPGDMAGHVMAPEQYDMPTAGGFHTYTVEWDDQFISTWVDGVKYHEFPTNGVVNLSSPGSNLGINQTTGSTDAFKKPFFLLLNLAVGGDMAFNQWTGVSAVNENALPGSMIVDYVKVFKEGTVTPPPPPPTPPTPPTTVGQLEAENANAYSVGIKAEACSEGGQDMGYLPVNGFLVFNGINFPTAGDYLIEYRVASGGAGGKIACDLDGGATWLGTTTVPGTGGWQTWTTVSQTVTVTAAGTHNFGINTQTAGYNLNWVRITPKAAPQQLYAVNANVKSPGMAPEACSEGGQDMGYLPVNGFLVFNGINFPTAGDYLIEYRVASGGTGGSISCDLDGGATWLGTATFGGTGGWQTWTTVSQTVTVTAAGTHNFGINTKTAGYNLNWVRITSKGSTPPPPPPPFSKQLEAEYADVKSAGMQPEACSEGGQDMGYLPAYGFLVFNSINFPTSGNYLVEYRVASGGAGGKISCDLGGNNSWLGTTDVWGTGGWQNWATVSQTVWINAGTYNFGVNTQTAGYNLNWVRITKQGAARGVATATATAVTAPVRGARPLQFYPNPVTTSFVVDGLREAGELTLRDYLGRTCLHKQVEANERVDISKLPAGIYVLTVRTADGQLVKKLVKQ